MLNMPSDALYAGDTHALEAGWAYALRYRLNLRLRSRATTYPGVSTAQGGALFSSFTARYLFSA